MPDISFALLFLAGSMNELLSELWVVLLLNMVLLRNHVRNSVRSWKVAIG